MSEQGSSDSQSLCSRIIAERIAGAAFKDIAVTLAIAQWKVRAYCRKAIKDGLATRFQLGMRKIERDILPDEEYDRRWLERLKARTVVNERGCLIWQGPVGHKGYILQGHRRWQNSGHRIVYRILRKKDLKTSDLVCHECDTRRCWNIDHLFIGTEAVNNRDCGNKGRHHNSVKTHCKRGHEFTFENTYLKVTATTVMRACLACQKIRMSSPEYKAKALERQRRKRQTRRMGASHVG